MSMFATTKNALAQWHSMFERRDLSALNDLIHPDAEFRSPMVHKPYHGRDALVLALSTVINIFEDFTYHRQFIDADGQNAVLEFSARVGDKQLKGVDLIKFNNEGLIVEFEVMVRPASGLMALGEEMAKRVGEKMATYKR